jgi:NDP-sugar pyrophosphorylase family protein
MNIPVVILAGGLATRLRPITETIPKSLVPLAGRPFLAHQLEMLQARRVRRVVMCVGFLGEAIREKFGNKAYGIDLDYSFDGDRLLGTGGAIKRALPLLGDHFFVLYGDSYLPIEWEPVADSFHRTGKFGLMTVYRNEDKYDKSNVVFHDGTVVRYDKKNRVEEMQHIDYGLSLFKSSVFEKYPDGEFLDLADVMRTLVSEGQLAGYEVIERFYEMGSPAGLSELETLLGQSKNAAIRKSK